MKVKTCPDSFDWQISMKRPQLQRTEDIEKTFVDRDVSLGVVGAIGPWNFPLLLTLAKVLPTTQVGNTVIVKPSPFLGSLLSALRHIVCCIVPQLLRPQGGRDREPSLPT